MVDHVVDVHDITVTIKGRTILSNLSIQVEEGTFHGIIGPNGAGKTTLFNAIQGFRKPAQGSIELLGHSPYPRNLDLLHMTTLYTTHHLDEAERLCDTVSIIENGRIIVSESPSTLIREADLGATVLLPNALHQADDIAALAGQSNVRVTRDGVSIRTHDTAGLFATLSNHHINTRGAQVHEGRLENVYLQLTGKDHVD